jgi:hypothetical protein
MSTPKLVPEKPDRANHNQTPPGEKGKKGTASFLMYIINTICCDSTFHSRVTMLDPIVGVAWVE